MNENRLLIGRQGELLKSVATMCFLALAWSCVSSGSSLLAGQGDAESGRPGSQEQCVLPESTKPIGTIGTNIRPALPLTQNEQWELSRCNDLFRSYGVLDYQDAMICHWWDYGSLAPLYPYCYKPLYFEDPNLERCGYSEHCCVQPFISGAHFFGTCGLLPFKMLCRCPCDCVEPLPDCPACERYSTVDNYLGPFPENRGWGRLWSRDKR